MGSHHKDTPEHKDIFGFHKMLYLSHILLIAAGLGLAAAAPREHGHGSRHHGSKCRTECHDVYEDEYEERETTECVTKWVPECKTEYEKQCRPTTKEVCEQVYEQKCSKVWKEVCEQKWEGEGDYMEWVEDRDNCKEVWEEECVDEPREKCHKVPDEVCSKEKVEKCTKTVYTPNNPGCGQQGDRLSRRCPAEPRILISSRAP